MSAGYRDWFPSAFTKTISNGDYQQKHDSVNPHVSGPSPPDGFSGNFRFGIFAKIRQYMPMLLNLKKKKITDTFTRRPTHVCDSSFYSCETNPALFGVQDEADENVQQRTYASIEVSDKSFVNIPLIISIVDFETCR
jgi:hypothetical protein